MTPATGAGVGLAIVRVGNTQSSFLGRSGTTLAISPPAPRNGSSTAPSPLPGVASTGPVPGPVNQARTDDQPHRKKPLWGDYPWGG